MTLPEPKSAPSVDLDTYLKQFGVQQEEWAARASIAQVQAAHAFDRLLSIAQDSDTGQARRIAGFLASTYNGTNYPFDLFELRAVEIEISDAMLLCLDALRWGKADLYTLVPDGEARLHAIFKDWQIQPTSAA